MSLPDPIDRFATGPDTLTMYSTPWCGYCKRLKLLLGSEGIEIVEVDVSRDREAEAFVVAANGDGTATVPTVHFPDGGTLVNPTLAQVKDRLTQIA